jgi:hypothetical protein
MNHGDLIGVATRINAMTSEKLRVGIGGELVGASITPKDFQIVKA